MNTSIHQNTQKFPLMDMLRGIAILLIVYFHGSGGVLSKYPQLLQKVLHNGYRGVDIFLIISGFVISLSVERMRSNQTHPNQFLKKRLARVYIPYWYSVLFSVLVVPPLILAICDYHNTGVYFLIPDYNPLDWIKAISLTKIFWATSWDLSLTYRNLNSPIWYLSIILQIYGVIYFALLSKKHYLKIITGVSVLSYLCVFPGFFKYVPYGVFLPFFSSFSLGVILYYLVKHNKTIHIPFKQKWTYVLYLISIFMIAVLSLFAPRIPFNLLIFLSIYLAFPYQNEISQNKLFKLIAFIGTFSYSLYLIHIPLQGLIHASLIKIININPPLLIFVFTIPLTVALSYYWYLMFEKPKSVFESVKNVLRKSRKP